MAKRKRGRGENGTLRIYENSFYTGSSYFHPHTRASFKRCVVFIVYFLFPFTPFLSLARRLAGARRCWTRLLERILIRRGPGICGNGNAFRRRAWRLRVQDLENIWGRYCAGGFNRKNTRVFQCCIRGRFGVDIPRTRQSRGSNQVFAQVSPKL